MGFRVRITPRLIERCGATHEERETQMHCRNQHSAVATLLPQIMELNVAKSNTGDHMAQLLEYLKSSQIETDLLISLGAAKLYIRKYLMTQAEQPPKTQRDAC